MKKAQIGDRNVTRQGYVRMYLPNHHRASYGWVFEHIVVMEEKLGRPIGREEIVHHIDHNRRNNDPENLMLIAGHAAHSRLHSEEDTRWSRAHPTLTGCRKCGASERPHVANGLCKPCYRNKPARWSKHGNYDCCLRCQTIERPHYGKGYCKPCYMHLFFKGAIPRTGKRSKMS